MLTDATEVVGGIFDRGGVATRVRERLERKTDFQISGPSKHRRLTVAERPVPSANRLFVPRLGMTFAVEPPAWDAVDPGDLDLSTRLGACCHGSRLLGSESSFVLHGGGNTSVKLDWTDITGKHVEALYVKGSGWDLATIEPAGFTPLRMERLHELLELDELSDENMARELAAAKLDPGAPAPSVESLLHAYLPFQAVQHSHADVIVALTNTADGHANVDEVFGDDVVVVPYVMPGFDLARLVARIWPTAYRPGMTGMVLLNHGLFTFGSDTRQAYERHVELIQRAQRWLGRQQSTRPTPADDGPSGSALTPIDPHHLSAIRRAISEAAGRPMIVSAHNDAQVAEFVGRPDLAELALRGPLTPDHIIRTKRLPQIGGDVAAYVAEYRRYFERNAARTGRRLTMLDPAPRVVLDPEVGMLTAGRSMSEAMIVEDIYRHTIDTVQAAEDRLGGYRALGEAELFDVEYWDLEQAKLRRAGEQPPLSGQVALVTGVASGIGRACGAALLDAGAAVIGLDVASGVETVFDAAAYVGFGCDVTDSEAVGAALGDGIRRFGGIDIAVVAAGVFPAGGNIAELDLREWQATMAVNVDAAADLLRRLHPHLAASPVGGRVVLVGSKNAPAPGPAAGAYSVSKAAVTQLGRLCALEWGSDGIRVNIIHPDAVFDTGLWSPELLESRAGRYGLSVEEYKIRNVLGVEVTSATVAELVVAMCGPAFRATTGAQIPIDGGNDRVI